MYTHLTIDRSMPFPRAQPDWPGEFFFTSAIALMILLLPCFSRAESTQNAPVVGHSVIDPFIYIVESGSVSDLTLSVPESAYLTALQLSGKSSSDNVYVKLGSYQTCLLSNDINFGVSLKVSCSSNPNHYLESSSGRQLVLYNSDTQTKIRVILVVTPAGWTKNPHTFGNATKSSEPSAGSPFFIGGDLAPGEQSSLYLQHIGDQSLRSPLTMSHLSLDNYGIINHYGLNAQLQHQPISSTLLADGSELQLSGCIGDVDPTSNQKNASLAVTFALYMNAQDLATATAGQYSVEYATNWADSDDLDQSITVYSEQA